MFVPKVAKQKDWRLGGGLITKVERREHGVGHEVGVPDFGELDQPRAIFEATHKVGRNSDRQAALANPARSDKTDQPGAGQPFPELGQLAAPADEARELGRQVTRTFYRSSHLDQETTTRYASADSAFNQ